jgi:hypothetical protein
MKQRIRAEAHGSSPAARSAAAVGVPAPAQYTQIQHAPAQRVPARPTAVPAGSTAIPAPRPRAHEALCE